jgi:ABC-type transport system involved in cytochrome bd biosynthesis fused ATPase/permease subunit
MCTRQNERALEDNKKAFMLISHLVFACFSPAAAWFLRAEQGHFIAAAATAAATAAHALSAAAERLHVVAAADARPNFFLSPL